MPLPGVNVAYQNGGLGLVAQTEDRVVGLICSGSAQPLAVNTPRQLFNPDNLDAILGSTDPYAVFARQQIIDFYTEAGRGAELWFMLVTPATATATLFTNGAVAGMLNGAQGRINVLGVSRFVSSADNTTTPPTILNCLDADILNAMDEAQALAVDFASRHMPLRIVLDGKNLTFSLTGLRDLKTHTFNRVGVCVGSTGEGRYAAMGLLMGRIAATPVHQNIGRVRSGEVLTSEGSLTNGSTVEEFGDFINTLNSSGYITLRQFPGYAGYYWNDDHMATGDTDDYYSLAYGRVIDKAARLVYKTMVQEVNDTVPVDEKGKIVAVKVKAYQVEAERAIQLNMGDEISFVKAFVDPAQDVIATSKIVLDLRITPMGTSRILEVKIGLYNPNAA
ncbi:DUF2586 family protein [Spirosoma aerolatum]|uniref:DUF2586 family protein n=1 Tax=Spirosoma aerolatum TaxID=1211326 RepID=UPI0009ABFD82|nr:DUF2586 family protein [Spirosoma aerolatum]